MLSVRAGVQEEYRGGEAAPAKESATRHLADIPFSLLSEHSHWVPNGAWEGRFDAAVWLRAPAGLSQPLQLALRYRDSGGEKMLVIDRCHPGSHRSVLLNGSILLEVVGRVREMALVLLDMDRDTQVLLDEWHLVPQLRRERKVARA